MSRAGVCATERMPGLSNLQPPTNLRPLVSREQSGAGRQCWAVSQGTLDTDTPETIIRRDHNIQSSECEKHPSVTDIFFV